MEMYIFVFYFFKVLKVCCLVYVWIVVVGILMFVGIFYVFFFWMVSVVMFDGG